MKDGQTMFLRRMLSAVACFFLLAGPPGAAAADFLSQIHPGITVKGEYNDNLNLTPSNARDDYITTVQPGIRYSNMDKASGVELDARLGYVFYSRNSNLNYLSAGGNLNAKYLTKEHVNFYLKNSFTRSDNPREREFFTTEADNRYLLSTQTERAVYWRNVAAPTVEYQFGPENRVGVNYRNNVYQTESRLARNSMENYINPFLSYWFDRRNGISLEYGYTIGDFEASPDLTGHRFNARYTNRFSAQSSVFAEYTYSTRSFANASGFDYDIHEPAVGIAWAFSPSLTASAQAGYFQQAPKTGSRKDGLSYKAEVKNTDPRTSYQLSLQGGYTEDYFTAENLGFNRYHRITGSVTHFLDRRFSLGCLGSLEWAEYDSQNHKDTVWGITGTASYRPVKWLTVSLEASHRERQSNVADFEYKQNRVILSATAEY